MANEMGHPLTEVEEVPERFLDVLRDRLSVTTVEQFLDLASRYPDSVQQLLDAHGNDWSDLIDASRATLSPTELDELEHPPVNEYPYMTGHDTP